MNVPVTTLQFSFPVLVLDAAFLIFPLHTSMEHRQPPQPSSISQLPLDDSSTPSRARQPLTDAAGNAQIQALASVSLYYHDRKAIQPRVDMPMYIPTVPSQSPRQPPGNTLELRRQSIRRQKHCRFTFSRNPIVKSPQYIAYRDRQTREGNAEDQKWPEVLEDAFLNGISLFSYKQSNF